VNEAEARLDPLKKDPGTLSKMYTVTLSQSLKEPMVVYQSNSALGKILRIFKALN
jgi:hypothetical protein